MFFPLFSSLFSILLFVMDPELFFFREFLFPDWDFGFYPFYGFAEGREKF